MRKTTFLYQFRIFAKFTCVHVLIAMEIFHAGLKIDNQMVSDMELVFSCILNLCDVRMRIAIACIVPRGYFRAPPLKEIGFWGSFYQRE